MKFSIIIPAYNEAELIAHTLEAVLIQSYADFEVVVVDNNSSDTTAAIVRSYAEKDQRIRLVPCPQQGLLHARNCGLAAATGDIIVQLDADNIPPTQWLANAERHLRDPSIIAVVGPYDYYDASAWFRYSALLTQYIVLSVGNWYTQKRKFGALMLGGNAFIRKSALEAVGGYDTTHTFYNEDLVTARAIAAIGQLKFYRDLVVRSSARRHKEVGYMKLQKRYNKGTLAVLQGRKIPCQEEEIIHPR